MNTTGGGTAMSDFGFSGKHVLVTGASPSIGWSIAIDFEHLTPGDTIELVFRKIIEINVMRTYYVTREEVKAIARGTRIVITASIFGKTSCTSFTNYCASKHAYIGFMCALAQELWPKGINVNAICPNWVRTETAKRGLQAERGRTDGGSLRLLGLSRPDGTRQHDPGLPIPGVRRREGHHRPDAPYRPRRNHGLSGRAAHYSTASSRPGAARVTMSAMISAIS